MRTDWTESDDEKYDDSVEMDEEEDNDEPEDILEPFLGGDLGDDEDIFGTSNLFSLDEDTDENDSILGRW